ncbi:MAG: hypothetical protein ACOYL6_08865 [Bacteriovoracaceae bacterium]
MALSRFLILLFCSLFSFLGYAQIFPKADIFLDAEGIFGLKIKVQNEEKYLEFFSKPGNESQSFKRLTSFVKKNLVVKLDGQSYPIINKSKIPLSGDNQMIELQFGKVKVMTKYIEPSGNITHYSLGSGTPHISTYDLRQFADQGDVYLKNWRQQKAFSGNYQMLRSSTELHTHFAGALRPESMIEIGVEMGVMYPVATIKAIEAYSGEKILHDDLNIEMMNGKEYIAIKDAPIKTLQQIARHLALDVSKVETFEYLEMIYDWRDPFVKDLTLFKKNLMALAADYRANGIMYAELSLTDVLKDPKFLEMIHEVLPEIKQKYLIELRFLAAIPRQGNADMVKDFVKRIKFITAEMQDPYIVGVDFMGHERNPTKDFAKTVEEISQIKEVRPDFQVRVHAGESAMHLDNVKEAILAGANRIGHGINGIDDATLELAKQNNVIIEFNLNSNLALNNIHDVNELPLSKYLEKGIPVVLSTDGHGMYHTSNLSEAQTFYQIMKANNFSDEKILKYTDQMDMFNKRYAGVLIHNSEIRMRALPADYLVKIKENFPLNSFNKSAVAEMKAEELVKLKTSLRSQFNIYSELELQDQMVRQRPLYLGGNLISDANAETFFKNLVAQLDDGLPRTVLVPIEASADFTVINKRLSQLQKLKNIKVVGVLTTNKEKLPLDGSFKDFYFLGSDPWKRAPFVSNTLRNFGGSAVYYGGDVLIADEIQAAKNSGSPIYMVKGSGGASTNALTIQGTLSIDKESLKQLAGSEFELSVTPKRNFLDRCSEFFSRL